VRHLEVAAYLSQRRQPTVNRGLVHVLTA